MNNQTKFEREVKQMLNQERSVSLQVEGLGNKTLTGLVPRNEVQGKTIDQLVMDFVIKREWSGEDYGTAQGLKRQLEGKKYKLNAVVLDELNRPVDVVAIDPNEPAEKYVKDFGEPEDQLAIRVTGVLIDGYW